MNYNVKGLVIKETAYGENDKILTLLAEKNGLIQVWARGCKRIKSPLLPLSHLFTYAHFNISESKGKLYIRSGELIENYFELRRDIERMALASYIVELACKTSPENENRDFVLKLTLNTLHLLAKTDKSGELIKAVYEMRFMAIEGYMPQLSECVLCGNREALYFDNEAGGILCENCNKPTSTKINLSVLKAIIHICYSEDKHIFSFALSSENLKVLSKICEEYILFHQDILPKTLTFYKGIL